MNILEMNHIKKKFDEKTVLKDISLSVKAVSYTHLYVYKRQLLNRMRVRDLREEM